MSITLTALWFWLPAQLRSMHVTSPLTELAALKRVQVWLALAVGMIGFGGMFAVYTYISTTMTDVAGLPRAWFRWRSWSSASAWWSVTWSAAGWRTNRSSVRCTCRWARSGIILAVFVLASHNPWTALLVLFGIGAAGSAVAPALQTRLMDVAHGAQTLAAALNHSALNIGNATGAWVGGLVIAAGFGYTAPAAAGALLAAAGTRGAHRVGGAATPRSSSVGLMHALAADGVTVTHVRGRRGDR